MNALSSRIKRIVYASIAGLKVIVKDIDALALVNVKHGHTVDGSAFCLTSRRVKNVISTDNDSSISIFEFAVDVFHFVEVFVLNVSLAEKNVHVSRHTACNGVNCVSYLSAACGKLICKFFYKVLSLSNSHTVAGDDNYVLSTLKLSRRICLLDNRRLLRSRSFDFFGSGCGSRSGSRGGLAQKDRAKTAVHSLAHDLSKEQAGCANDTAYCNEQEVVDCKTCNCACHTAEAVKERDGDRHICAANSYREDKAEQPCENCNKSNSASDIHRLARLSENTVSNDTYYGNEKGGYSPKLVCLEYDRLLRKNLVELTCCDKATEQGNHTYCQSNGGGNLREYVKAASDTSHSKRTNDCACRTA